MRDLGCRVAVDDAGFQDVRLRDIGLESTRFGSLGSGCKVLRLVMKLFLEANTLPLFLGCLLFKITDPNHKTRYPKKGVGYEPLS